MKIAVNLASHPYIELRPIYSRLRTWIVILAVLGGALWYLYRNESDEARAAQSHVASVENHVRALENQQREYRAMMQAPKDAAILQQSEFLNGVFQRKAFSWTATMTDLESVLPTGVEVVSIDPVVAPGGNVVIRLRVTGERDRALDLVRNLEQSRHFAAPRLASESLATAQGQRGAQNVSTANLVNFELLADYRPLPLDTSHQEKKAEEPGKKETAAKPEKGGAKGGRATP